MFLTSRRQQLAACFLLMAGCSDESPDRGAGLATSVHDGAAGIDGANDASDMPSEGGGYALPMTDGGGAAQLTEGGATDAGSQTPSPKSLLDRLNGALAEDPGNLSCARTFSDDSTSGTPQALLAEQAQIAAVLGVSTEQLTVSSRERCGVVTAPCTGRFEKLARAFGGSLPKGLVALVAELENGSSAGELTTWQQSGAHAAACVQSPIDGQLVGVCVIGGGTCAARGL